MQKLNTTPESILNCAQSLMIAGGYNGFSYADIAAQVGIRKASIHHHFPSKADLVHTLVKRYRHDAETGIHTMAQHIVDPREQLKAYVAYWEKCITDTSSGFCLCALLAVEIAVLPVEVALEVKEYFHFLSNWLASVLELGAKQGSIRLSTTAAIDAEIFMATIHGAMMTARAYGNASAFVDIAKATLARLIIQE